MYSPDFLSCPTTSGSPPVRSISLSDHNLSAFASSLACTLAHSRPRWRSIFFSNRAFNLPSNSFCCAGDKSFLFPLICWGMDLGSTCSFITFYFYVLSQALSSSICSGCNQRRHGRDFLEHAH